MKKYIPNIMTFGNLLSGVLIILLIDEINLKLLLLFFPLALIFDYLDGFIARKLNVASDIGLNLDSLADIVSFGLAPFFVLINFYGISLFSFIFFIPLVIAGAYHLARFNTNPTSHNKSNPHYEGFPIPTLAILIPLIVILDLNIYFSFLLSLLFLVFCLLVSLEFLSFKKKLKKCIKKKDFVV